MPWGLIWPRVRQRFLVWQESNLRYDRLKDRNTPPPDSEDLTLAFGCKHTTTELPICLLECTTLQLVPIAVNHQKRQLDLYVSFIPLAPNAYNLQKSQTFAEVPCFPFSILNYADPHFRIDLNILLRRHYRIKIYDFSCILHGVLVQSLTSKTSSYVPHWYEWQENCVNNASLPIHQTCHSPEFSNHIPPKWPGAQSGGHKLTSVCINIMQQWFHN